MMTAALFTAFYYGLKKETGWTSLPAKLLFATISAWFACIGIFVDIVLIPLAIVGWLSDKLRNVG